MTTERSHHVMQALSHDRIDALTTEVLVRAFRDDRSRIHATNTSHSNTPATPKTTEPESELINGPTAGPSSPAGGPIKHPRPATSKLLENPRNVT